MAGIGDFYCLLTTVGKRENVISKLAEDPLGYLSTCNYTEDDILRSITKAVVSLGDADFAFKLKLLILLQEHSAIFISNVKWLEETIECLTNYFGQLKSPGQMFLKCQVLVTHTTILLNFTEGNEEAFGGLFSKHCDQLWKLLALVNNKDACLLREIACECLITMETHFPCLFLNNLEDLCIICLKENSYPFQNFANLVSCILKNAAKSNFLIRTNRLFALMQQSQIVDDPEIMLKNLQVGKAVANLLDVLPLCSCASVQYIISNICCSADVLSLNPYIFKTFIHRSLMTSSLLVFYTLLKLKEIYQDAFSEQEETILHHVLIDKANHSSLNVNERCIVLSWISRALNGKNTEKTKLQDKLISSNLFSLHFPFDNLDVSEKKMNTFFLSSNKNESCKQCLPAFLKEVCSHLFHDDKGYYIASLYRVIYCCISENVGIMESDYQSIVLSVVKNHPQFLLHTLDLINNVKLLNPSSSFPRDTLSTAVHHITNLSVDGIQNHLHQCLQFLGEAAKEKAEHSQPKAIIKFLRKVVDGRNLLFGKNLSWLLGHSLLDICKRIICCHSSNNLFTELGELLFRIITQHKDIDVKDRAQFYYMLLTTISHEKMSTMFQPKVDNLKLGDGITNFISGDTCYGFPLSILFLKEPILKLTRIVSSGRHSILPIAADEHVDASEYLQYLDDSKVTWNTNLHFSLEIMVDSNDAYNDVYGIILSFSGPNCCGHIQSVQVPYLNKVEATMISIEIAPLQPLPATICVNAVFSSSSGRTCYNELHPVNLLFEDLFQLLPVPSHQQLNQKSWRNELTTYLWKRFTAEDSSLGNQSILRLHLNELQYQELRNRHLQPFITEENGEDLSMFTVGVFLPPKNHLIMKIKYKHPQNIIVSLASDSIGVLAEINLYFCRIEKQLH